MLYQRLILLRQEIEQFDVYVENWEDFKDLFFMLSLLTPEAHFVFYRIPKGKSLVPDSSRVGLI